MSVTGLKQVEQHIHLSAQVILEHHQRCVVGVFSVKGKLQYVLIL